MTSPVRAAVSMVNSSAWSLATAIDLAQLFHQRANLRVGNSGVVLNRADPRSFRQDIVEMSTPSRRVLAVSKLFDFRVVQNAFDAPAHPARCLGPGLPDRLENLQH